MARRYRLSNVTVDMVSLVPAGDDPLAKVVLAKAEPELSDEFAYIEKIRRVRSAAGEEEAPSPSLNTLKQQVPYTVTPSHKEA